MNRTHCTYTTLISPLFSRVIEISDDEDDEGHPKFALLPKSPNSGPPTPLQTRISGAKTTSMFSQSNVSTAQPSIPAISVSYDVTSSVIYDDAECPPLDASQQYWISFTGARAGVFDNM